MGNARVYARNVFANWFGYAANLAVMFFLTPFVITTLGDKVYGVWTLLVLLTGYMGLVELGVRNGMGRFVNYYLGKKEPDKVNGIISTAMVIFLGCGVLLLIAALTLGHFFGQLFPKTPPEMLGSARLAILLIAANLFISFYCAAFLQVLAAHERFEISNGINLGVLLLRATATVVLLRYEGMDDGGRVLMLAWITLGAGVIQLVAQAGAAWRIFPALRISPKLASRACFRELYAFSIWAAVSSVALQVLYWFDTLIIGVVLGPAMVTLYSIGGMFVIYGRGLVTECSTPFAPQIIKDCATRNFANIRQLAARATAMVMGLSVLLFLGFVFFGEEFIRLWMMDSKKGDEYATFTKYQDSYKVMAVLALAQLASTSTIVLGHVFSGLNRVRLSAMLMVAQAVVNVALTLTLLLVGLGLVGVAAGSAIPRALFAILSTVIVLNWIGSGFKEFAKSYLAWWAALAAAFGAACWVVVTWMPHGTWLWFAAKIAVAVAVYAPLVWFFLLTPDERAMIKAKLPGRR
ncbi:MAG: MATE family efflux transporter [Phycisphaerae bacterium]|nr:MATE family efflux transporter [Phycisphaerae bacterium]